MSNITMMELSRELDEQFDRLVNECRVSGEINQELIQNMTSKRGLRDANGKGVLTGLTEISDVVGYAYEDGRKIPADGQLYFQGYNVADMVASWKKEKRGLRKSSIPCCSDVSRTQDSLRCLTICCRI